MSQIRENSTLSSDTNSILRIRQAVVTFPGSTQQSRVVPPVFQSLSASTQIRKPLRSDWSYSPVAASTERHRLSDALYSQIEAIFWIAKGELFEDGMESTFSQQLNSFIKKYANDAIEAITCLIVYERVDLEVAGEALRWLGRIDCAETYKYRRWLLERSLSLPSTRVKDGAILGLASMDDKHAISYLKSALEKEQCSELKADMQLVLEQLES